MTAPNSRPVYASPSLRVQRPLAAAHLVSRGWPVLHVEHHGPDVVYHFSPDATRDWHAYRSLVDEMNALRARAAGMRNPHERADAR